MNTVQIRLKSQRALVGIGREPARYNMRWQPPQLKMKRTPVSVQLKSHGPSLKLDQQAVWEEIGTGGIYHVIDEALAHSRQQVIEAIGRIALEGDFLAAIENPGNTIAALAEAIEEREFNVGVIPRSRPSAEIIYHVKRDWKMGRIDAKLQKGGYRIEYQPGHIRAYLRQKHYLKMWAEEKKGNFIDWQVE